MMFRTLDRLVEKMTPDEQAEVETFAAFVLTRRNLLSVQPPTNDIPVRELTELVSRAGGFDWLEADEEDIYSADDGEEARWPSTQ